MTAETEVLFLYADKFCDKSYDSILNRIKRIHFVGIGGSGMCPLAEIMISKGYDVSGSDMNDGDTLRRIISYGIPVYMGHEAKNVDGAELVVYTAAVKPDNIELVTARKMGIPTIERSVMLGIVTRRFNRSIAVSGTHGKTTTTAMISQIMIGSGAEPTAIIGGTLPSLFSGALITETLFGIPGIGFASYQSMVAGDIPFSMFFMVFTAILTLLGNLIADVLYAVVDPRVRIA